MDDLASIIGFLVFALLSILHSDRARKKKLAQQKALRPPTASWDPADADEADGAELTPRGPAMARSTDAGAAEALRRAFSEQVLGIPVEPHAAFPVTPPLDEEILVPAATTPAVEERELIRTVEFLPPPQPPRPGGVAPSQAGRSLLAAGDKTRLDPSALPVISQGRAHRARRHSLLATVATKEGLRHALLVREVLGPPRCLEPYVR